MNETQKALLELIKKSQLNADIVITQDTDWDAVYDEASHQFVLGIIAYEIPVEVSLEEKWQQIQLKQMASYIRYCYAEDDLKRVMNKASIPFVVLKGNSAAISYSVPSRRAMGDIDFIVPNDVFERTKGTLLDNGYCVIPESDKHPRHIGLTKNGVLLELHRKFSHEDVDIEQYVIEGIDNACIGKIDDHEFPMLPKLANGLVLLDHMRNHLKGGLGLRQVIDWMMYVYRNLDDDFWENEFSPVVSDKGMNVLAITATKMCQLYLGLPETITWCKDADQDLCETLMENLLSTGNFGRKNGHGSSVEFVSTNIKRRGLFSWLQYIGEINWEAYHRHHWLKPFCWVYQIFRYARKGFRTGRSRKQLSDDLDRSEQRYELLKKLGIE